MQEEKRDKLIVTLFHAISCQVYDLWAISFAWTCSYENYCPWPLSPYLTTTTCPDLQIIQYWWDRYMVLLLEVKC